jgi:hypothetical protein
MTQLPFDGRRAGPKEDAQVWPWRIGDGRPERDDFQGRTLIVRAGNFALDRFV